MEDVVVNIDSTYGMLGDCLDCDLQDLEISLIVSVYTYLPHYRAHKSLISQLAVSRIIIDSMPLSLTEEFFQQATLTSQSPFPRSRGSKCQ